MVLLRFQSPGAAESFVSLYRGQPIGAAAGAGVELYYMIRLAAVMVVADSGVDLAALGLGPELPRCPTCAAIST